MEIFAGLLGTGMISLALYDIFHELFHPSGHGDLSRTVARTVWLAFRRVARWRSGMLTLAGPAVLIVMIVSWAALLTVGWTLVFWPFVPEGFVFDPGTDPSGSGSFVVALYMSLVTLTTLGFGDVVPGSGLLRLLVPLEAISGFGLLTISISWVLSVYPALSRHGAAAHQVVVIQEAGLDLDVAPASAGQLLSGLAAQLAAVRNDLVQLPVTYYFHSTDERSALPAALPYLYQLAREGAASNDPEVRLNCRVLRVAIEHLAATLATGFLDEAGTNTEKLLDAYARDHLREPLGARDPS